MLCSVSDESSVVLAWFPGLLEVHEAFSRTSWKLSGVVAGSLHKRVLISNGNCCGWGSKKTFE